MTASPTPEHNFDTDIVVERQDDFWWRKWGRDEEGRIVRRATAEEVAHDGSNGANVHLPSPSYWPIVVAAGLPFIAYGLIYNLWLCVVGWTAGPRWSLRLGVRARRRSRCRTRTRR